jgi:hypothetical protein
MVQERQAEVRRGVTSFWIWIAAGCACSALFGFSVVRFGARIGNLREVVESPPPVPVSRERALPTLAEEAPPPPTLTEEPLPPPTLAEEPSLPLALAEDSAATPTVVRERPAPRRRRAQPDRALLLSVPDLAPKMRARSPLAPTAPEPEGEKLALWARQIKGGERKMSVATDGCRVTWNRTCKHHHPSWLVYLGYLEPGPPPPKRHTPR